MSSGSRTVVDTSPIIYLSAIDQIGLLKKLFSEIFIPNAVKKEIVAGGEESFGVEELNTYDWIKIKQIKNRLAKEYLLTELDEGEAEVIILAEELKADFIIMDDKLGRKIAKLRGFNVLGTLRLLVAAKEKGLITELIPLIVKLKDAGFWISEEVYKEILRIEGGK